MNDAEAALIVERAAALTSAQWPNAHQVVLCLDCDALFRRGYLCLFCGSKSIINLAAIINRSVAN